MEIGFKWMLIGITCLLIAYGVAIENRNVVDKAVLMIEDDASSVELQELKVESETMPMKEAKEFSDYRGRLCIPGTGIDYPVMQGEDDSYYLKHSYDGRQDYRGSLFFSWDARMDSQNRTIHGHNMGNEGSMFTRLLDFRDQDFFDAHDELIFEEAGKENRYRIFAVMVFDHNNISQFHYMKQDFTYAEWEEWVSYIRENSINQRNPAPEFGTQVLTLSTCLTAGKTDYRVLVFASASK